jgi:Nif-specific regulatory protein
MGARLTIEIGQGTPAVYDLVPGQTITLGRHRSNTIVLHDEHASRRHAQIAWEGGRWTLREIEEPCNGTRVDGQPVDRAIALKDGQAIAIGDILLRFQESGTDVRPTRPTDVETRENTPLAFRNGDQALRADSLTALFTFVARAAAESDPSAVIHQALTLLAGQTGAKVAGFLSLDSDDPLPRQIWPEEAAVDVSLSRQLTRQVQSDGRAVWLGGATDSASMSDSLSSFSDAICVPLNGAGTPLGALHLYRSRDGFTERNLRFAEVLAGYLANSLHVLRARRSLEAENLRLKTHQAGGEDLIGKSSVLSQLRQRIARAAPSSSIVLICGESGVGKELVALALHRQSPRHEAPLVVVNCAAIAASMMEGELFGHCKGAFTGADRDRDGLFKQADEGTLFLDEVGELSLDCQAKLLRVIETKRFRPVGGNKEVQVDVRIIAATNRDLAAEVRAGRFREDLFYRLQVISIPVPPLREHAEDIPILVEYFLARLAVDSRRALKLTPAALARLQTYTWPGNVRQLRLLLESLVHMSDHDVIDADDLLLPTGLSSQQPPSLNLEELEVWAIRQALRQTAGNQTQAAKLLGIVRDTLSSKIKKYGIGKDEA